MSTRLIKTVALIYLKDRQILLSRNKGKQGFYMVGGKIDPDESLLEALNREVKEELSVDLIDDSIKYYGVFEAQAYGETKGVLVNITCYIAEFAGNIHLNGEVEEVRYFTNQSYQEMSEQAPAVKLILEQLHQDKLLD